MKDFNSKKILFFCPKFFGYEKAIFEKLCMLSKECVFFDERAEVGTFGKICIRLNRRKLIEKKINDYYKKIIESYDNNYFDIILFFNPETVTVELLKKMKQKQKKAKFILYMWDSFNNKPHSKELLPLFDKCLTFNKEDSEMLNMKFRPLFFIDEYNADNLNDVGEKDIDICFIGTIHSDRYRILKEIESWAKSNNFSTYFYMYFPSKLVYFKYKFGNLGKIKVSKKDFNFRPLSSNEILSVIQRSKVVVDIQHPKQTGLTMRTIETLGLKKKLITTNIDISNYDFYNTNNIFKIDRENIVINKDFIDNLYDDSSNSMRCNYSIDSFINEIIS